MASRAFGQYYYAVRYYDSGHPDWKGTGQAVDIQESAAGASGGTLIGHTYGLMPLVPGSELFDRFEEKVQVVPNILRMGTDQHTIDRRKLITFRNLPAWARIEIYDVTGQLVTEEFHNSVYDGVFAWFLTTFADDGKMAPGIYFWRVISLMPQSMNQVQKGTFLVIQ